MNFEKNNNHKDLIVNIFCIIDDLKKMLGQKKIGNNSGRKASLNESEVITIMIFGKMLGYKAINGVYWHIRNYFFNMFKMPHYKNFVELVNKYAVEGIKLLSIIMNLNQKNMKQNLYFIDSSKIAVCGNKRIFNHKVCKGVAERGKSSMGRFFGFKLHIITDSFGNLIKIRVTSGNVDDRNPVISMMKNLTGILVGDAGYLGEELRKKLLEKSIQFLTGVKKNMKKLMTKGQHTMFKARQIVETSFSVMKGTKDLVSSFARSINGHFARITYALLSYSIAKQLNNQEISIS